MEDQNQPNGFDSPYLTQGKIPASLQEANVKPCMVNASLDAAIPHTFGSRKFAGQAPVMVDILLV